MALAIGLIQSAPGLHLRGRIPYSAPCCWQGALTVFIDWQDELKRPVSVGLAVLAFLGWVLAVYFMFSVSSLRDSSTRQIAQIAASRDQLTAELDRQRQAAGTLEALQTKATETTATLNQAMRERDDALGQLAATRQDLDAAKQLLADTGTKAQAQTQALAQLRTETDQAKSAPRVSQNRNQQPRAECRRPVTGVG